MGDCIRNDNLIDVEISTQVQSDVKDIIIDCSDIDTDSA